VLVGCCALWAICAAPRDSALTPDRLPAEALRPDPVPTTDPGPPAGARPISNGSGRRAEIDGGRAGDAPAPTTTELLTGWAAFDAHLEDRLIGPGNYTMSVAVAIQGEVVHRAAFGIRNLTTWELADTDDRFRIASISKVITAIVALQLVEDGTLELDQPVGELLAQRVGATIRTESVRNITVRELLSHTSALPKDAPTFFSGRVSSCEEAGADGLSGGLNGTPGGVYDYSNMNFCLLGLLIEQVTGKPYQDVVYERLLTPLGITGMRVAGTFDVGPDEVQHRTTPGRNYMEVLGASGAWIAAPSDLVRILDSLDYSLDTWHPLSEAMSQTMRDPPLFANGVGGARWYGMGLMVRADGTYGHTGTIESTHAMVLHRADGVTWAVTVNGDSPAETADLERIIGDAFRSGGFVA
jgi:D-alanyl-D-alanine carboxypeptidase